MGYNTAKKKNNKINTELSYLFIIVFFKFPYLTLSKNWLELIILKQQFNFLIQLPNYRNILFALLKDISQTLY